MSIEMIYQNRSESILTLIDLIYSPDKDLYYLEKWIFDLSDDNATKHYQSINTFGDKPIAKLHVKQNRIAWERR